MLLQRLIGQRRRNGVGISLGAVAVIVVGLLPAAGAPARPDVVGVSTGLTQRSQDANVQQSYGSPQRGPTSQPRIVDPARLAPPKTPGSASPRPHTVPRSREKVDPARLPRPTALPAPGAVKTPVPAAAPRLEFTQLGAGLNDVVYAGAPPDPGAAAGDTQIVETVNKSFSVYNKNTTPGRIRTTSLITFFGTDVFDPHVSLDYYAHRFAIVASDGTNIHLGISRTQDALGQWCNYTFGGLNSDNPGGVADYPLMTFDGALGNVYISVAEFNSSDAHTGTRMLIINRDQLVRCQPAAVSFYANLTYPGTSTRIEILTPVTNTTSNAATQLAHWVASHAFNGGTDIALFDYTTADRTLTGRRIPSQLYSRPPPAAQKGTSRTIDTGDSRIFQATKVAVPGTNRNWISFALTSACTTNGTDTLSCPEWFILAWDCCGTLSFAYEGIFGFGAGWYLYYPAGTIDQHLNMILSFNASGTSNSVSAYAAINGGNPRQYGPTYTTRLGSYIYAPGTTNPSRWGDFSSLFPDPAAASPDRTACLAIEGTSGTNHWGTQLGCARSVNS